MDSNVMAHGPVVVDQRVVGVLCGQEVGGTDGMTVRVCEGAVKNTPARNNANQSEPNIPKSLPS